MITGTLTARKANDDSAGYRIIFDDGTGPLEVGSVSERISHTKQNEIYWRWGVDTMPLMDHGGHVPSGQADSREAALQAFKAAFFKWLNDRPPGDWQRNRDNIKASAFGRG